MYVQVMPKFSAKFRVFTIDITSSQSICIGIFQIRNMTIVLVISTLNIEQKKKISRKFQQITLVTHRLNQEFPFIEDNINPPKHCQNKKKTDAEPKHTENRDTVPKKKCHIDHKIIETYKKYRQKYVNSKIL